MDTRPQLQVVTDTRLPHGSLLAALRAAAENGADVIQVRDHRASARDVFDLVRTIISICRPRGVRVVVNDRIDVALAAGADAVQLGRRSVPVAAARAIAAYLAIGASVHDSDGATQAELAGADWVTFGHVFPSASHAGEMPCGVAGLAQAVQLVHIPVIAIGGIDASTVEAVMAAGASGIAVISAILHTSDAAHATAALRRALDRSTRCQSPVQSVIAT